MISFNVELLVSFRKSIKLSVSLNIVSLSIKNLKNCGQSEKQLEKLISFKLSVAELDMDWTPNILISCVESQPNIQVREGLDMVLNGRHLVNENCPDHAFGYQVYSKITMLTPQEVQLAKPAFDLLNWEVFQDSIFRNFSQDTSLANFHLSKMSELSIFMKESASFGLAIAQWWD